VIRIPDDTFAAACYNDNSVEELVTALAGPADEADMKAWGLTAEEWREGIELALEALLERAAGENA
jgi:hypothetical protein